eukprot:6516555-Pyramimonas_sp.AAC.1
MKSTFRTRVGADLTLVFVLVGLDTAVYDVRKELTGELNSRVIRWLNKGLNVNCTVSLSIPRYCWFGLAHRPCKLYTSDVVRVVRISAVPS